MKIVSSILPEEQIQDELKKEFPNIHFKFYKGMDKAKEDFYDADVFITYGEDLTAEHVRNAKNLKWIMVMSAGLERMPFNVCIEKNILVTNAKGIHKVPMAEYTIGMMLQFEKRMKEMWKNEESEQWNRRLPFGELYGKILLVLGVGAIGGEVSRLAKAFQMNVLGVNRSGKVADFVDEVYQFNQINDILPKADYIVSVLPSTKETKHLLTEKHFRLMKNTAVFINIGRGDLVEEKVLLQAMEQNEIAHAFLDVFYDEPLKKGHRFWKMDNITVTPHISSITKNYLPRAFFIFKHNLHTYINHKADFINVIDLTRGY